MSDKEAYEWRVGRWSQMVGRSFVEWLGLNLRLRWLEIGCGTGALSRAILDTGQARTLVGIDPSDEDLALTREALGGERAEFRQGVAEALPFPDGSFNVTASGLVFNFLKDAPLAFREMQRVTVPGGCIAGYVWDFGGEMQIVRRFWDATIAVDSAAAQADQAVIFPFCKPELLRQLFLESGLQEVLDLPLVAILTQLRQELLDGIDTPTASDKMLADSAILAFRNLLRVQGWIGSLSLSVERELFGQYSLEDVLGQSQATAVAQTVERLEMTFYPLLDRAQRMMIRALDRLEARSSGKSGAVVSIGSAGQVNVGGEVRNEMIVTPAIRPKPVPDSK